MRCLRRRSEDGFRATKNMKGSIHHNTWKRLPKEIRANVSLPSSQVGSKWVEVDFSENAPALSALSSTLEPIFCDDNVWRVATDYSSKLGFSAGTKTLEFAGLRFSHSALLSSIRLLDEQEGTSKITRKTRDWLATGDTLQICKEVCKWGGTTGNRVWGNLKARYQAIDDQTCPSLRSALHEWLADAATNANVKEVIASGISIRGLGVSYASKHLRILFPERHATLDSLISDQMGFALNPSGYALFIESLSDFRKKYLAESVALGELESGLFRFIRYNSAT